MRMPGSSRIVEDSRGALPVRGLHHRVTFGQLLDRPIVMVGAARADSAETSLDDPSRSVRSPAVLR
jgi:hypothetical protein